MASKPIPPKIAPKPGKNFMLISCMYVVVCNMYIVGFEQYVLILCIIRKGNLYESYVRIHCTTGKIHLAGFHSKMRLQFVVCQVRKMSLRSTRETCCTWWIRVIHHGGKLDAVENAALSRQTMSN